MTCDIKQIVAEVQINAPREKVWKAMWDRFPQWWPEDFLSLQGSGGMKAELWAGGRVYEEAPDGRQILWGNFVLIQPGEAFEVVGYMTPTYGGPSVTMWRFALSDCVGGTQLRITDSVLGAFPEGQAESLTEGWSYLATSLKQFCEA